MEDNQDQRKSIQPSLKQLLKYILFISNLNIDLQQMELVAQPNNIKSIADFIELLSYSDIIGLELNFQQTQLNKQSLKTIGYFFKKLSKIKYSKINNFSLNLVYNLLGEEKGKHLKKLSLFIKSLKYSRLEKLSLNLKGNYIGQNQEDTRDFFSSIQQLKYSQLKCFSLNLNSNRLGNNENNLKYLQEAITELSNYSGIRNFGLELYRNDLGGKVEHYKQLGKMIEEVCKSCQIVSFYLCLYGNNLGGDYQSMEYIKNSVKGLKKYSEENQQQQIFLQVFKLYLSINNFSSEQEEEIKEFFYQFEFIWLQI